MTTLRIMTFNVENMLARFRFREFEKERLATLLDIDSDMDRANLIRTHWNVINDETRVATALAIRQASPEVVCVQEVETLGALKAFHDRYLRRMSDHDYRHKVLIDGNDPRGIDVAVMSRFKIDSVTTHQDREGTVHHPDGDKTERIFRRDCLEVHVKKQNRTLPIFVCHFKSMSGGRERTKPTREAEAAEVRKIIEERFADPAAEDWMIVGDLNDYTEVDGTPDADHALGALLDDGFCVDMVKRIEHPHDRWTHYYDGEKKYSQLDYVLISPALADKNPNTVPEIIRHGQPYRAERYQGDRFPRTGWDRPKASDHCGVVIDLTF